MSLHREMMTSPTRCVSLISIKRRIPMDEIVHRLELGVRDEIHHFGWNACSAALCPYAPHPYIERRYLVVPALRGSSIYILDVKEDPKAPKLIKTLDANEVEERSGYTRPHTVHCGPEGIYVSALASAGSEEGPGGIFLMDHYNFNILGSGKSSAVRNPSLTISGGTWAMILLLPVNGDILP